MIKTKDITPSPFACAVGACPAVFSTDRGTLLIIGREITKDALEQSVRTRVSPSETVVEVPIELLRTIFSTDIR